MLVVLYLQVPEDKSCFVFVSKTKGYAYVASVNQA